MSLVSPVLRASVPSRRILPIIQTAAAASLKASTAPATSDHQVTEIEEIITSFKHLLSEHPDSPAGKGIRHEIFVLERWLRSFRQGLISTAKLAANGPAWLSFHRGKLAHASEKALLSPIDMSAALQIDSMVLTSEIKDAPHYDSTPHTTLQLN